jgi:toxin-antitoxin system PIN domain toxin
MTYLLDANALIALAWPEHTLHERVARWFERRGQKEWATCAFTQSALVRILSNPSFSEQALTPADALLLLEQNTAHPNHRFWSTDISLQDALEAAQITLQGHQQVTDAYLVGLARHKKGVLATCDASLSALLRNDPRSSECIELIS